MAFERVRIALWLAKENVVDSVEEISDKTKSTVFSGKVKKEALKKHDEKLKAYNDIYQKMNTNCNHLYMKRKDSIELIKEVERVINSITNTPKEFDTRIGKVKVELANFKKTEDYAKESFHNVEKAQKDIIRGAATGAGIATMAPTALMSLATTFGTASTGTAISALSGAAAQKAAVAWIGRTFAGVAVKNGAGMLAGQAFLALAGPVGWGITAATTGFSLLSLAKENEKIAAQAMEETKEIVEASNMLRDTNEKIKSLIEKTRILYTDMEKQKNKIAKYLNADFMELQQEDKRYLGSVVNNTLALAELLNKSV